MTPCVITDGPVAYAENSMRRPICVGCEKAPKITGVAPPRNWEGEHWPNPPERRNLEPWIAVDLDGTLAVWEGWLAWNVIGPPIPKMVERIQQWLREGRIVRIMTARVAFDSDTCHVTGETFTRSDIQGVIARWTKKHIGTALESTAMKDFAMEEQWDDKAIQIVAIQIVANTGLTLADEYEAQIAALKGKPDTPPPG
jgi:hypothetical protein